tara:strand:- start:116 stop:1375 length:1260 start_codon:yes stop_codon:yes gene_type:complete
MDANRNPDSFLGPYRVLDLTDEKGLIGGKLMGDLGADIIKVESPGGDVARNIGPFYHDDPHPEKSLYWMAFNLNKRGVTLDLETSDGKDLFLKLVKTSDFVIESFNPGYMESIGLSYEVLSSVNPRIIVASITPFGQTGPYKDFKTSDLINMAMGGYSFTTGDPDRPPVRISFPISFSHAGAEAAAASVMAHYHRELTGEGQHIDISIQECIVWTLMNTTTTWDLNQRNVSRAGSINIHPVTGLEIKTVWECKDGEVTFTIAGGALGGSTNAITRWMGEEKQASEWLLGIDWPSLDILAIDEETYIKASKEIGDFILSKTANELYAKAVSDRIILAPVSTAELILSSPQLQDREGFIEIAHSELGGTLTYPNAFAKMSAWNPRISRRAPLIGEHNNEIYIDELGLSQKDLIALRQSGSI